MLNVISKLLQQYRRDQRQITSSACSLLKVCVVGSGPAGFYTVDKIIKHYGDNINVDILERLPSPFGLVRTGVAPDHPDTKNVTNQFARIAQDARVNYLGNVCVGRDVSVQELRSMYSLVVLAYGAESDRKLGIPGEDSKGVHAAREFVWWYNGHPDQRHLPVDLSKVESVAVCGIGNVALDCARVLLRPVEQLASTDIAQHALQQLRNSRVKQVHLCARRGPVQAACTPKELKEIVTMPSIAVRAAAEQMAVSDADKAEMKAVRLKRRVFELISTAAAASKPDADKQLHFQFFRNPAAILADQHQQVEAIRVEKTHLVPDPVRGTVAVGTGEFEEYPVQLVLKSIGYKSLPLEGVPFDSKHGVVPNAAGRVLSGAGAEPSDVVQGLYVCGWLKRGPTGIIGTNLTDAEDTVHSIVADDSAFDRSVPGTPALLHLLQQRGVKVVDWCAWSRMDTSELQAGKAGGACRVKMTAVDDMLAAGQGMSRE